MRTRRMRSEPRPIVVQPVTQALSLELVRASRARESPIFLAEGVRSLVRAVDSQWPIAGAVTCPHHLKGAMPYTLLRRCRKAGVPILETVPEDFQSLILSPDSQGILLLCRKQAVPLAHVRGVRR